ncbi:MAG: hypothetical protein VXY03_07880 [Bacteroidota bacterium]|nr:hypothetical protein [Bacteroidota bacterium]
MTSAISQRLGALTILAIWMVTVILPCVQLNEYDTVAVVDFEHSEQEAESEELSMECEETTFEDKVTSKLDADQWHIAHLVNVRLHERLDASRLLDPPDQHRL